MSFINTVSGKKVNFLSPSPDMICIEDIAYHLSNTNRFAGAVDYTVAQHSIWVSRYLARRVGAFDYHGALASLHGLLHDAAEAYMGDIPKPLKNLVTQEWDPIEERLMRAIYCSMGMVPPPETVQQYIKEADTQALIVESKRMLDTFDDAKFGDENNISSGLPLVAAMGRKQRFIDRFNRLNEIKDDLYQRNRHYGR